MVLDFGLNHDRHGLWNEARFWSLNPPKKKKKASGLVPVRSCQNCGAMLPAQQLKCDFCGVEIGKKELELLQGELIELTPQIEIPENLLGKDITTVDVSDLLELDRLKLYSSAYIWRNLRSRGEQAIKEFAEAKGFKSGWTERQVMVMYEEAASGGTKLNSVKIKPKTITQNEQR